MKKYQKGFTLIELFAVIAVLLSVAIGGSLVYVGWHFIAKFW